MPVRHAFAIQALVTDAKDAECWMLQDLPHLHRTHSYRVQAPTAPGMPHLAYYFPRPETRIPKDHIRKLLTCGCEIAFVVYGHLGRNAAHVIEKSVVFRIMQEAHAAALLSAGNKSYVFKAIGRDVELNHACIKSF